MKRINPITGVPFKRGDIREDGFIFYQYQLKRKQKENPSFFVESWLEPNIFKNCNFLSRSGNARTAANVAATLLRGAKNRCLGIPSRTLAGRPPTNGKVTIDKKWVLEKLNKGICEATGDKLTLQPHQPNTASLDRIDPNNYDYTPENCRITTWQFNNIKGSYSDDELIRVLEAFKNVKKK